MCNGPLRFDPVLHYYFWRGRRVPSVTQALAPLFDWSLVPRHILQRKAQIGRAVHAAIHLEITGGVDESSIDPSCRAYFDAWRRFRDETLFEPVLVEFAVSSDELGEQYRYAGTLDEWGFLQGDAGLIDWKCSLQLNFEAVGSQLAAYLKALVRMGLASISDKRFALKLLPSGRYELVRYRHLEDDWLRFARLLKDTARDPA